MATSATSATAERANSALRSIKNDFWSTMSQDCFNAFRLIYVHRYISLNYNGIIGFYARKFPR